MLKTENDISEKDDTYFSQSESRNVKRKLPRMTIEFDQIYKLYAHKLNKLSLGLEPIIKKFWHLLEHNTEGEIEKKAFLEIFSKFFRFILPVYNWSEIQNFLEGEWTLIGTNSWNFEQFAKYLFNFIHTWSVHVNSLDYSDFLDLLYERTTKWVKTFQDGTQKEFHPLIKTKIVKIMSVKEYQEKTWEMVETNETVDRIVMETPEGNMEDDELNIKRPFMQENYLVNSNFVIYNEEVFYENEETFLSLENCETLTKKLINDEEIVILGFPTQYILTYFKNNLQEMHNLFETEDSAAEESVNISNINNEEQLKSKLQSYKIEDCRPYANKTFYYSFDENCNIRELFKSLEKENNLIVSRDILSLKEITIKDNYIGEISIYNNLRRNNQLDRFLNFQKIILQNNCSYYVNVDSLIISSSHRKALENLILNGKIGIKSTLWSQKITDKIENIIKNKFSLIHNKLLHFLLNSSCYSTIIESINSELKEEKNNKKNEAELDINYFKRFESKLGIEKDSWDTDYDIIQEVKKKSPVILVIGKPLTGKTSVSKKLAEELNMVYLDPEKFFANIFLKVAKFEEEMQNWEDGSGEADDQGGDAARPKKVKPGLDSVLSKLELRVYSDLMEGREISKETMLELYIHITHSDLAYSRGLVIDLQTSIDDISFAHLVLDGYFGKLSVDYVVNLVLPEEELLWRKNGMMFNLKTLQNISKREIEVMKKPKIKKKEIFEDEDVEEEGEAAVNEEIEITDEQKELIPTENDLLVITNFDKIFADKIKFYEEVQLPKLKEYYKQLKSNYYIQVNTLGLDYDEVTDLVKTQLEKTIGLRYIAKSLEAGDYKDLLMTKREGILPFRKWSLWKQTDPVALKDEYLILNGLPEFAVEYLGKVFLFASEENKNKFLQNPKKYLDKAPAMPKKYRVCILGPPKSGKNTVADLLSEIFGWKKINLQEIYDIVKDYQKNWDNPENNNVYATRIHFSNAEFKEIITPPKKGEKKQENFVSKIVFMLDTLGIKLDKKRTFQEFLTEIEGKENKLQHLYNKLEKQRQKALEDAEKLNNPEQENSVLPEESKVEEPIQPQPEIEYDPYPPEEEYTFEDIRSDQFYYAYNMDGTVPRPGGFIMINNPSSLEEIEKLKEFNIVFDKIIYLVDQSEEPLKALAIRKNPNFSSLDEEKQIAEIEKVKSEVTKIEEIISIIKEKYNRPNEECVLELNCVDTIENIKLKLIQALDPFYMKVDAENLIISNSDINLEEKAPIQKGEFGNFCPVTYKNERWLYYCTEEFEVHANGRKYRLASQNEQDIFRKDPSVFLNESKMCPVNVPPPHIFFTGFQGGGVTHFTSLLSKEFKLRKRELKPEFMQIWNTQSSDRKQIRINKKREDLIKKNEEIKQNNAADPSAEPQELINIEQELQNDATLEEEEEGFNPVENDKNIFKKLFQSETASIYDSTWFDMNEKIQTPLMDFLIETRKVPNIMIILRLTMKSILERHLRIPALEEEHLRLSQISLDKKKLALEKLIQEKKEAKLEEMKNELQEMGEPEINPDDGDAAALSNNKKLPDLKDIQIELSQEEQDEIMLASDPDLPELSTLINTEKEKLIARYESNNNFLTALKEQLKEKLIPVIDIYNDSSPDMVYKNLLYELRPFLLNRTNLIEQQLVTTLPELNIRKTRDLSSSEVYSLSSWGSSSPVRPEKMSPRTNISLLYRDKLYFFNNEEEKRLFSEEPLTYRQGREFPRDLSQRLVIYTIGLPRSGKTTLANMLESLGFYRLTIKQATSDLLQSLQACLFKTEIESALYSGRSLDDHLITKIIERRISLSDLIGRDVVIDGFPLTLQQANLIIKNKNCRPNYIFYSELKEPIVLERMKMQKGFKSLIKVVNERFINSKQALKDTLSLFEKLDYDIKYFNMEKSLWYCKDLIIDLLENRKKFHLNFISKFNQNQPALLNYIVPKKVLRNLIYYQGNTSKLSLYSPVSFKMKNEFWSSKYTARDTRKNNIIYYKDKLHFLRNEEELNLFLDSPFLFENILEDSKEDIIPPKRLNYEHISSITHIEPTFEREDNESIGNSNDPLKVLTKKVNFEYQACCPITILEDKQMKEGHFMYVVTYLYKYYRFDSSLNLTKFLVNPHKYFNMTVPVKKRLDEQNKSEAEVDFENTVNYLETNFASLITKGMLELSKNRIKFPYISVKETSIKYLALFLKANNPNNNEYAKSKYKTKFDEFLKNSKIPFDLMNVYENHVKETNTLKKQLIRKQLNNLADKYDDLMDKAKTLTNTRFQNFFK